MAQNDNETDPKERWRFRYYEALEELEVKEKAWRESDRLIRQLVSRLTLAADSRHSVLTKQLKDLKNAIRDGKDIIKLKTDIDAIGQSITELDKLRKRDAQLSHPVAILAELLDMLAIPKEYSRETKKIKKQLGKTNVEDDATELIENVSSLINATVQQASESSDEKPTRKQKLLDRILSRKSEEEKQASVAEQEQKPEQQLAQTAEQQVTPETEQEDRAPDIKDVRPQNIQKYIAPAVGELLLQLALRFPDAVKSRINFATLKKHTNRARGRKDLMPIIDVLAGHVESAYVLPESLDQEVISLDDTSIEVIANAVARLLELLNPPQDLKERVEEISNQFIKQANDTDGLVYCLNSVAEIIAEICSRLAFQRNELESFFHDLDDRLLNLGQGIEQTASTYKQSFDDGQAFGEHVKGEIHGMQENIDASDSLDTLKTNIRQRLDSLDERINVYQGSETERYEQQQQTIVELQQHISELETDSEKLRDRLEETKQQAYRDVLTGIPNRQAYEETIASEVARSTRYGSDLSMVVWDVDKFKSINDTYGHASGDRVLKVIADILNQNSRQTDFVARYGGEEFVMLMPETKPEIAKQVADKLREMIQNTPFHFRDERVEITISAGVAQYQDDETTIQFFERTDAALYKAKEGGRNQVMIDG